MVMLEFQAQTKMRQAISVYVSAGYSKGKHICW